MRLPAIRRMRGTLIRLTLARRIATSIGAVLVFLTVVLSLVDFKWESWLTDGFALFTGALGAALLVVGFSGRRADWVDPSRIED